VLRHEVPQQEGCIESQVREAKFLQKSLCRHGQVDQIVTDRLASYGAALKVLGSIDKREVGRWLNNRVENSLRGPSVPTSRFDDENGPCFASGECEPKVREANFAEVRRSPRLDPQPLQPGTHPHQSTDFQGSPRRRSQGMASALRGLIHAGVGDIPRLFWLV
jgi:hypothetical protein